MVQISAARSWFHANGGATTRQSTRVLLLRKANVSKRSGKRRMKKIGRSIQVRVISAPVPAWNQLSGVRMPQWWQEAVKKDRASKAAPRLAFETQAIRCRTANQLQFEEKEHKLGPRALLSSEPSSW